MMATRTLRNRQTENPILQKKSVKSLPNQGLPGRKVLGDITSGQNIVSIVNAEEKKGEVTNRQVIEEDEVECMETDEEVDTGCLPAGVKDIDSADLSNPQLCAEYVNETFTYLRSLEASTLVHEDHLVGMPTNSKMRSVLVDWLVEVQVQFKLLQETIFSTVDIVDRFMAIEGINVDRSKLQLVGVASMFLASKIEEVYAPACSDFVYITDEAYTEGEIKAMELKIAKTLNFALAQPTAINFLRRISKAGDVDMLQHNLAKYNLELSLTDYTLVPCSGSSLAAASLCVSLLLLEPGVSFDTVWTPDLAYYSGYSMQQIHPLVKRLLANLISTYKSGSKVQAVRNKYKSSKFLRVSDLGELKGDLLQNLAK